MQVRAVRDGMSTIVPVPLLSLVTPQHLEQLVCGMPHVSIDVLKKVVRFVSLSVSLVVNSNYTFCVNVTAAEFDFDWLSTN